MGKKKKRYPRKQQIIPRFKVNVRPSWNRTLNTSFNPFLKRYPRSVHFIYTPVQTRVHFLSSMRKDSAMNPFTIFHHNSLNTLKNVKKKDLNWFQAKSKYPKLRLFGDADKDGVLNMFDCKPFDPKRQDNKQFNICILYNHFHGW